MNAAPAHAPSSGQAPSLLAVIGVLLREPERLLDDSGASDRDRDRDRLAWLAPKLLAITVIGAAIFGAVLGSYRGELQYLYAAVKTPLLLLVPMVIGLPAIRAFHHACEIEVPWSRLALTALLAMARTAILAAACGPVLWLYLSLEPDYHHAILVMVATLSAVACPGLVLLVRSMPSGGRHRPLATLASVAVLGLLLAQSGWLLRPFVVRPQSELSFLRPIEADVFSSLASTRRSATGDYREWETEGAGLLGREAPAPAKEPTP